MDYALFSFIDLYKAATTRAGDASLVARLSDSPNISDRSPRS
jgi:hypothetical protein